MLIFLPNIILEFVKGLYIFFVSLYLFKYMPQIWESLKIKNTLNKSAIMIINTDETAWSFSP